VLQRKLRALAAIGTRDGGDGEHEQAAGGEREPEPHDGRRALSTRDAVADHRELHDAEQHERADRRADAQIGEREGRGVGEQRERAAKPATAQGSPRARLDEHDDGEHDGAGGEPDRREARRVQSPAAEREPRQQRVRREGDEREQGERDRPRTGRAAARHRASLASTRNRRSMTSH
jgi:hypothetical protein